MSLSIVAVVAMLATGTSAHMIMASPVPFSIDKLDNSPVTAEQFPCKSNIGYTVSTMNKMTVGAKQPLTFHGSAVHGGGSCQLSITTDPEPTKDSVFKVIKSIEGGCPGIEGPEKFEFELPDSIPNGKATFAWTWFAKLSGGPEMYMNCAPIEVSGGASDKSKFDELPNMFVGNMASTTCKSQTSKALKFPNPGSVLQANGDGTDVVDPTGDCGSTGTTPSNPSKPSGSSGVEPPVAPTSAAPPSPPSGQYPTSAAPPAAPSAVPTQPGDGDGPGAPSAAPVAPSVTPIAPSAGPVAPPASPTQPGDGYGPGAPSAAPVAPSKGPVAPPGTRTTLVTVTGKPTRPGSGKPTAPGAPGVPMPTGTGSPAVPTPPSYPSTPSAGGDSSGTCTKDGAVVCKGSTQFGLCNKGKVEWQAVAAGTMCTNGVIAKRGYNGRIARPRLNRRRVALSN